MPFLVEHHDPLIVGQSIAIAIFSSYVAVDLVARAFLAGRELARAWWIAGSMALGTGIWAMHFVGMLSLTLPIVLGYAPLLTALSWLEAVGTSMLVLRLAASEDPGRTRLALGAVTMGAGICSMHYTGMAALDMSPAIAWGPSLVATSLVVSVAGSGAALLILRRVGREPRGRGAAERLSAALIMGLTISAMHYTGMAAAAFPAGSVCLSAGQLAGANLGPIVAACAAALLAVTLAGSIVDARQQSRTALQAAALRRALDASEAATRELAFERERLSNFIAGTDVGTWEWRLVDDVLEVDGRGARIVGYTLDELRPLTLARWRAMTHPDDVSHSAKLLGEHLGGALERYDCESRVRHKDGHWVWLLARGKIIRRDAGGAPTSMAGTHMDITERKGFEAELRRRVEKEDMYRQVFDAVSESILVRGPDSSILWANRAFLEFFGTSDEQLRGCVDVPFAPVDATARYLLDDARVFSSGQALDIPEELVRRFDGTTRRWHTVKSPLLGTSGEVVATVGVSRDITARREAEAQARHAGELMRGAIDAVGEAFVLYDPEERLVYCNDKYRELFGDAASRIVEGVSFEEVLRIGSPTPIHGSPADADADVEATGLAERLAAFRIGDKPTLERLSDGRILRSIVRKMADGHTVGFRIDITELMRATDVAKAALVSRSQFLANMSHEIRTPMNAVLGMLSLLRRTALDALQDDYAAKAERAARSLLGLLNDILDFSKVEAGKMTVELQPFDIHRLLQDLMVILGANVGSKPVALRLDIDPALPPLLVGDATRLLQVLINLGGNAVKFTDQGEVVLSIAVIERLGQPVTLEFGMQDSGIGIAPENQARIFSEFTQAEASTTRRFGGTGLGLTISARLVALMGGQLQVASALGEGSRFFFRLTLDVASAEHLPLLSARDVPTHGSAREPRLSGLRVLLAEDNPNNQQVARELMELEGALVSIADDGQQALDALRADGAPFDLVLMDVQMPVLDGLAVTRLIRDDLGLTALPIVAMTANAMDSDRRACIDAGMDDHVGKPFDLDDLVRTLTRHAGHAIQPARAAGRARSAVDAAEARALSTPCAAGEQQSPARPPDQAHRAAQAADVEFDVALARLGGHRAIYTRMLARFLRDAVGMDNALQECRSGHRAMDAVQIIHTLRGLAGTLGLRGLAARAAQAERLLGTAADADALDSAIGSVRAALCDAAPPLSLLLGALEAEQVALSPAGADVPFDAPAFDVALLDLVAQLRLADMAATESMQEICTRFGAALGQRLQPLEEAIDGLDFERALALCDALAAQPAP